MKQGMNRRQVIVTIGGVATVLMLPNSWTKPILQSVIVPAHAQASPPATTGGPTTTTPASGSTEPPEPSGTDA